MYRVGNVLPMQTYQGKCILIKACTQSNSVPLLVKRINAALQRADQIEHAEGKVDRHWWFAPIVADAEAGFGGTLNALRTDESE